MPRELGRFLYLNHHGLDLSMRLATLTHLYAVCYTLALLAHLQLAFRRRPQADFWREKPAIRLVSPHLEDLWR
jgi:hypothetical protein